MHARSGAWRCCDGKERAARVQCELLLAGSFTVLCWTLNLHWYVLLGSSKKITSRDHWITAFSQIKRYYSSRCPSCLTKALRYRAIWRLPSANVCEAARIAKGECLRRRANCQVRMFVKQPNRWLQQLLAVENKTNFAAAKTVNSLHDVPTDTNFLSTSQWHAFTNALHKRGHLKSAKNECLWSSIEKTAKAFTCRKKYLCSSKNSQICMICSNSVKKL